MDDEKYRENLLKINDVVMENMKRKLNRATKESPMVKIGIVYCDDYELSQTHVVVGIHDHLKAYAKSDSRIYMFKEGLKGLMKSEYMELRTYTAGYSFTNIIYEYGWRGRIDFDDPKQLQNAEKTVRNLQLDGLVFIGEQEAMIHARRFDMNLREKMMNTCVVFCPTKPCKDPIEEMPLSLSIDHMFEACSEAIANVVKDAESREECYHFLRLIGPFAEVATARSFDLPSTSLNLLKPEMGIEKWSLKDVRDHIVDVICERSEFDFNYGVIMFSDDVLFSLSEVRNLFSELEGIFSVSPDTSDWMEKLTTQSRELYNLLPERAQGVVLRRSRSQGNPRDPKIDVAWTLIEVVTTELEKRKNEGLYTGEFKGIPEYIGPLQQDYVRCYGMGYIASELISKYDRVGNLSSLFNECVQVLQLHGIDMLPEDLHYLIALNW